MKSFYQVCRDESSLSSIQIRILENSSKILQFASDLSQREVTVYVPGKMEDTLVMVEHCTPLLRQSVHKSNNVIGTSLPFREEPLLAHVLRTGEPLLGAKERFYGKKVPMMAYPFMDNAGITIAVITFVGQVTEDRALLTETALLVLQVPQNGDMEKLYQSLSVQDGIIIIAGDGEILYSNEMAERIFQLLGKGANLKGRSVYDTQLNMTIAKRVLENHQSLAEEMQYGNFILFQRLIPLLKSGKISRVILIVSEQTMLREKEKEILVKNSVIKEIHHRVKNNLQTIASLLRMQLRRVNSDEAKYALQESLNRILSMALIHEILSHHDDEIIEVTDVSRQLLTLLVQSLPASGQRIQASFAGTPLHLPSEKATSLAMVINEVITNAIRHGFAGRQEGQLDVELVVKNQVCTLTIKDNGVGIKKISDSERHLGLKIINVLVEKDLQGGVVYTLIKTGGTAVNIQFPI